MQNIIGLKNISLFKISIFILISLYFHNIIISTVILIYLIFDSYENAIVFAILILILNLLNKYHIDIIPFGIVDYHKNNYYVINKLFYKVIVYTDDLLINGDILSFINCEFKIASLTQKRNNILYTYNSYNFLRHDIIRYFISNQINNFTSHTSSAIYKLLYNYDDYQNIIDLGHGLTSYYFLKNIQKKSNKICLFILIIISICFTFEFKYFFIILSIILNNKISKKNILAIIILFTCFINYEYILNYSICLSILLNIYSYIDFGIDFKTYLALIESFFFGEINLLGIFLYKYLIQFRILCYIGIILLIMFPPLEKILKILIDFYSYIIKFNIPIRGTLSITGLLIYLFIKLNYQIKHTLLNLFILIICILLPINNPFFHISFIDVGQGDATLIKYGLSKNSILIDTGSIYNYQKLKTSLFLEGLYSIDYLIISHDDSDHSGNIDNLKNDFNIKNIITKGQDIEFNNIQLSYLYIDDFDNYNDNSLVYLLNIDNLKFLFTGDISKECERIFLNKYGDINIDVLKVAHHGSNSSSSDYFISKIMPKYAVISTSGQYNHPNQEVLDTLNKYNCYYFITKSDGTIKFYFSKLFKLIKTAHNDFVIIK